MAAAAASHAVEIAANVSSVESYAAVAAAAAAASVAGIPIVGPEMAVAAAADTFLMLQPYAAIASASGGFDVPRGLSPLTQLHPEEMVLPAELANTVRANNTGQGGGSSGDVNFHIYANDSASVAQWLKDNARAIAQTVAEHQRFNPSTRGNF